MPKCDFLLIAALGAPVEARPLADREALLAVAYAVDFLSAFGPEAAA